MRTFEAFSLQHAVPIIFFLIYGILAIRIGRKLPANQQRITGVVMSAIIVVFMVGGSIIKISNGTFNYKDDLPLYLCRIIAWVLPFAIMYQSRLWLGIFYFWTLAGTLQGIITPDLAEGYPSYFYFRYWFLHAGLVVAILYAVIVFRVRITWKDFWLAIGFTQAYLILIHLTNVFLGSNYSFTMRKPVGDSIVDLMGPWPWYILTGQGVMIVLFLLLMLPWMHKQKPLQPKTKVVVQ